MTFKKVLSIILAVAVILSTLAVSATAVEPSDYDSTMLSYILENQPSYIESEYTHESWTRYASAYSAADANSTSTDLAVINYHVAYLAAAQAGLVKIGQNYYSKLVLDVASYALASTSFTIRFKDLSDAELQDVSVVTDNESVVVGTPTLDAETNFYTVVLDTSTLPNASQFGITVNYTVDGKSFTAHAYSNIGTPGSHFSASKGELGARVAYEVGYNRQSWMYTSGWSTYQSVLADSYKTYNNPTATASQISRAVFNINSAVASLASDFADYSAVYSAIAEANELDPNNYYSFTAVTDAIAAVVYNLPATRQDEVDTMALNINNAMGSLVLKIARYKVVCNYENGDNIQTSDWITGTMTYVVRVMAPAIPGYAPTVDSIMLTLSETENYATFTYIPATYQATFYPMGGTVTPASKQLVYDDIYGELPTPVRPGYTFLGWFSDPIVGEQVTEDTPVTVNYFSSLYAHWSDLESYTLTFVTNDGSACADITQSYGTDISLPIPVKYGYDLVDWYYERALENVASFTTVPDLGNGGDTITLYAKWIERTYDVTLDACGGTSDPATISVTYGSTYGTLPTPTKDGHDFLGWFTQAEGGTAVTADALVSLENVHSIYAHWSVGTYTLSFDTDGGTAILPITQVYGTALNVTAPTKDGYIFEGWTNNDEPISLATMPAGNITVMAKWKLNRIAEYSFFIYKKIGTQIVPADTLVAGERFFIELKVKTNYLAGQGRFGIFFDNRVVAQVANTAARAYTWNTTSDYISAMGSKGGIPVFNQNNWASLFEDDPSFVAANYTCTAPTTTCTAAAINNASRIDEETTIVTINMMVKSAAVLATAGVDSISIFMDERTCRNVDSPAVSTIPTYLSYADWDETQQKYIYDSNNIIADVSRADATIPITDYTAAIAPVENSTTVVDHEKRIITGLAENLSFTDFAANYATVLGTGTGTLACTDSVIKTGSVIQVMNGTNLVSSYTAIIYGDVDSNSKIDANDAYLTHMIINGLITKDNLTAFQYAACDTNHDGVIGLADTLLMERSGLKKATVIQSA